MVLKFEKKNRLDDTTIVRGRKRTFSFRITYETDQGCLDAIPLLSLAGSDSPSPAAASKGFLFPGRCPRQPIALGVSVVPWFPVPYLLYPPCQDVNGVPMLPWTPQHPVSAKLRFSRGMGVSSRAGSSSAILHLSFRFDIHIWWTWDPFVQVERPGTCLLFFSFLFSFCKLHLYGNGQNLFTLTGYRTQLLVGPVWIKAYFWKKLDSMEKLWGWYLTRTWLHNHYLVGFIKKGEETKKNKLLKFMQQLQGIRSKSALQQILISFSLTKIPWKKQHFTNNSWKGNAKTKRSHLANRSQSNKTNGAPARKIPKLS